jgi:general stress protein 26
VFLLPLLIAALPAAGAPNAQDIAAETISARRTRVIAVARQVMTAARYCTFVTLGANNQPQARVVDPIEPDAALNVYVATNPRSRKVAELRLDPRVTLLYFDPAREAYVTLIGRAEEVAGPGKAEHHKKEWQAFFPRENPDSYTLYRIIPSRAEVVSARDGLSGDPATWRPEIVDLK